MGIYYFQVQQGVMELEGLGMSSSAIQEFLQTSALSPTVMEQADIGNLRGAYQAYSAVLVGASGALYGVLVGFAMLFPNAQLMLLFPPIPIRAKFLVPILIVVDLFFGFSSYSMGPIAHFAHVGGALTGLLMMWYWKRNQFNSNRWNCHELEPVEIPLKKSFHRIKTYGTQGGVFCAALCIANDLLFV